MFQNGSACFRLHVGHTGGEAAEGEGCCCCTQRMLIPHNKNSLMKGLNETQHKRKKCKVEVSTL